jgi:hypothetical protein
MAANKLKKWPVLSVSHVIWMTREERYSLASGNTVEVIATSLPVWFYKGTTSEPAQEVFCKYVMTSSGKQIQIRHRVDGYDVNIPLLATPADVPLELWEELSDQDKEDFRRMSPAPVGVKDILDLKDGGSEWFFFRQYTKVKKADGSQIHLVHYVEIKDMTALTKTFI